MSVSSGVMLSFLMIESATGKRLEDIEQYVAAHPDLRRVSHHVPHRPGIAGVAANFVLHVSELIDAEGGRRPTAVPVPATPGVAR